MFAASHVSFISIEQNDAFNYISVAYISQKRKKHFSNAIRFGLLPDVV